LQIIANACKDYTKPTLAHKGRSFRVNPLHLIRFIDVPVLSLAMVPPSRKDVNKLINELSTAEKVSLCSGQGNWSTKKIERLGIPAVFMSDGPHGPRWMGTVQGRAKKWDMSALASMNTTSGYTDLLFPVTNFPSLATLGSSWNRDIVYKVGQAIAEECRHLGIGLLLAPGVNIVRHPLCGRAYEYFSEDTVLTGELGASYVKGVQSCGVSATVKHFSCYNAEYERLTMDSIVEERPLREIYLAVFERIIREAHPAMVMDSYNKVNGVSVSENKRLLTDILRGEWGFDGVVISDWWAINDRPASLNAGLDLEMPQHPVNDKILLKAVEEGKVSENKLNETCERILTLAVTYGGLKKREADFDAHHALARRAAAESIVLLKNSEGILPLNRDSPDKIAVIGSFAKTPRYQGRGSSLVNPRKLLNPLDEIKAYTGSVLYADGYVNGDETSEELISEAKEAAGGADIVILFVGIPESSDTETQDRSDYNLPKAHTLLIDELAQVSDRIVVVLQNGSAVATKAWEGKVQAILEAWLGGEAGAGAVADILFGVESPSGKLAVTFPVSIEDTPGFLNFPGENGRHLYQEGIFVGYRYYDAKLIETAYPFGFGLSYTEFKYSKLESSPDLIRGDELLTVSFDVTNVGERAGAEVPQLYVRPPISRLKRPPKDLKNFTKVFLEPGETKRVVLDLKGRDFAYYDDLLCRWVTESGVYGLTVGSSSEEIRLEGKIEVRSSQINLIPLTADSYCYNLFDNPYVLEAFKRAMVDKGIWPRDVDDDYLQAVKQNYIPLFKSIIRQTEGSVPREVFERWLAEINDEAWRLMEASVSRDS